MKNRLSFELWVMIARRAETAWDVGIVWARWPFAATRFVPNTHNGRARSNCHGGIPKRTLNFRATKSITANWTCTIITNRAINLKWSCPCRNCSHRHSRRSICWIGCDRIALRSPQTLVSVYAFGYALASYCINRLAWCLWTKNWPFDAKEDRMAGDQAKYLNYLCVIQIRKQVLPLRLGLLKTNAWI